jgi:DNA-binding transcriptional LysR family regulator
VPLLSHLSLAVRELMPRTEVTSRSRHSPVPLLDDRAAGRLEAAVLGDNPDQELQPQGGVVLAPLVTEPVCALLPTAHPPASQNEVALAQVPEEPPRSQGIDR